ncbi:MAG: hypothetical protein KAW14_12430 [Candidatus Aegiribacteria sp.]|nr:hypothetical protein [Candidatus Aegiribacteria sp.]
MIAILIIITLLSQSGHASGKNFDCIPLPLETPPFEYTLNDTALGYFSLELISCEENSVTDYENWFVYIMGWPAVTYHNGGINDEIRGYRPPAGVDPVLRTPGNGKFHLYQIIYGEESVIAFYGSPPNRFDVILYPRILCILDFYTFETELVLDFITYSNSPGNLPQERDFVFQQLKWAEVEDGILYVSTAHRTYAESSGGFNAYITAIDLKTLEILWRSRPLVSNSENFIIAGDMIITGYGFTAEEDFIYLLNRLTGEVIRTYDVPSAPEYLYKEEDILYVRCYNSNCVFEIRR